jgi:hypothetical protein
MILITIMIDFRIWPVACPHLGKADDRPVGKRAIATAPRAWEGIYWTAKAQGQRALPRVDIFRKMFR